MSDERAKQIFNEALELEASERDAFLDANVIDPDLRQVVRELLESHVAAGSFLSKPCVNVRLEPSADAP